MDAIAFPVALRSLVEAFDKNELREELRHHLWIRHGIMVRTSAEECAVRELVALCDVDATSGYAETRSFEDADVWNDANFTKRRRDARVPLLPDEAIRFLADCHHNYTGYDSMFEVVAADSWTGPPLPSSISRVVILYLMTDYVERNSTQGRQECELTKMLDAMNIPWEVINYHARAAVVALL